MDINKSKIELAKSILEIENPVVLKKIKALLQEEVDFWETLTEEEKEEIKIGLNQLNSGEKISFEESLAGFKANY